jgi:hypothetical protein
LICIVASSNQGKYSPPLLRQHGIGELIQMGTAFPDFVVAHATRKATEMNVVRKESILLVVHYNSQGARRIALTQFVAKA